MLDTGIPVVSRTLQGKVPALANFNVTFSTSGLGSGKLLTTLRATATHPLLLNTRVEIITAFNATTANTMVIGTTANGTDLLGTGDITEGTPGFYPTSSVTGMKRLVANTPIYVTYYGNQATGTLTSNNTTPTDGDTVTVGGVTYTFKTALTPTAGQVLIAGSADAALLNLIRAINHSGTAGTDYANLGTTSVVNPQVTAATSVTSHAFAVTAILGGTVGNAIATTETAVTLSWGAATLTGGTDPTTGNANIMLSVTPLFAGT